MITRNDILIVILASILHTCKTTHPPHASMTRTANLNDSALVDSDGNTYPVKLLSKDVLWITSNLKLDIPGSFCYDNKRENCESYGRLYTWASARTGCSLLGEGWRLPTNDEWAELTALYVMGADSSEMSKNVYNALIYAGDSKFNAVLGGGRDSAGHYARLEAHGFYWTLTENGASTAWFYNFARGSQALYQQDGGEKTSGFSVRCVRRIDTLQHKKR